MPRLYKQIFFSNSSWTTPHGVRFVIVTGSGGGGGGGSGASVSGQNFLGFWAGGGCGGQPAPTSTQIVEVTPGTTYSITIGTGGTGAAPNFINNFVDGGGATAGNAGTDGNSSFFGGVGFPGGAGGARGEIHTSYILAITSAKLATFPGSTGLSGPADGGGGGTGGGRSNNIYSAPGGGGQGAFGFAGYPFSTAGGGGGISAGGGGGGGGEGKDYNNTGNGSSGGNGGAGFIEVSWVA